MDTKVEQGNVKFCVKLGKSVTETLNMSFEGGRTSLQEDKRSGRPSMSITPKMWNEFGNLCMRIVGWHAGRRMTINDIADIIGVSYRSVQTILTSELYTRRVAAKFVAPPLLSPEQKEHRVAVRQDLRGRAADNPSFTSRITTGDEFWVYGYNPETKRQSQWKSPSSPRPNKARMSRRSTKTMFIVFFDIRGIVHPEFVPQSQTVNTKVLLRSSAAFEGEHSVKATRSVAREELNSPR
jgi:hypothetical protein